MMKISFLVVLTVGLIGCEAPRPGAALTADQAQAMAIRLANDQADVTYHRQPFHDGQPPRFAAGRWTWRQLAPGDLEAVVELAADGSSNRVTLTQLTDVSPLP